MLIGTRRWRWVSGLPIFCLWAPRLPGPSPVSSSSHPAGCEWVPHPIWWAEASWGCSVSKPSNMRPLGKQAWISHWENLFGKWTFLQLLSFPTGCGPVYLPTFTHHLLGLCDLSPLPLSKSALRREPFLGLHTWAWLPGMKLYFSLPAFEDWYLFGKIFIVKETINRVGNLGSRRPLHCFWNNYQDGYHLLSATLCQALFNLTCTLMR